MLRMLYMSTNLLLARRLLLQRCEEFLQFRDLDETTTPLKPGVCLEVGCSGLGKPR